MPFIPHTDQETVEMLATLGEPTLEALFDEIPPPLRTLAFALPEGLSELDIDRLTKSRAALNRSLLCFAGAGAYEHYIPAAIWQVAQRGEYYSAYTPYQPEASQGTLQVLYEYQTMMANLTGLDVSNGSLYDGASALAEAALMAVRLNPRARRLLVPDTVHPRYRKVLRTLLGHQQIEIIPLPYALSEGRIDPASLVAYNDAELSALIIPQPNYFGGLEDVDALSDWAHAQGILAIGLVNPTALGLLKPPGEWGKHGVSLACGDGQPLGAPLSGGGPYFGFLCCRQKDVHQMPGRLVGATLDVDGKPGFTLTLQAREQHIRRGKARSNICTNQGLMVVAATLYLALLGPEGLRRIALRCHDHTRKLQARLSAIADVEIVFAAPFFHETVLRLNYPVSEVLERLANKGILGGCDLSADYPELGNALLVCATEMRQEEDIEVYGHALEEVCLQLKLALK